MTDKPAHIIATGYNPVAIMLFSACGRKHDGTGNKAVAAYYAEHRLKLVRVCILPVREDVRSMSHLHLSYFKGFGTSPATLFQAKALLAMCTDSRRVTPNSNIR